MHAFFYDTWAFVALANARDPQHALAAEIDAALEASGRAAVTSDFVLDETITLLHVAAGARVAVEWIDGIEARARGDDLQLVDVSRTRRAAALALFRRLAQGSPRLSFTDCTSFAIMRELGIELAFTADRHFLAAGGSVRPIVERVGRRWRSVLGSFLSK